MPPARKSAARTGPSKMIGIIDAKQMVLNSIAQGFKVEDAMASVSRSGETYRDWMKKDPEFKAEIGRLRGVRAESGEARVEIPDFPEFCRDYLFEPLFEHQLRAWDVLNGALPRAMHASITYEPGDASRCLFNFPPNHAKTTSYSINYSVWRIHKDPNVKIAIISKSQGFAKKILAGIKTRLISNKYRSMHERFAPDGGWRDKDQSWTQNLIYVQGKGDGEKDPTVEAVGLGGQIYGGRFDVIICDDVIDTENAHRWSDQVDWLMTILDSRLPPEGGLMMVLGTRISAIDLYSELRKAQTDEDQQFFSYLAQPAVLDYGDGAKESWVTLWPYTNCDKLETKGDPHLRCLNCATTAEQCECAAPAHVLMNTRWSGTRLAKKRFPLGERRWSLVWQQQQIPDDATFNQFAVAASINNQRKPGPMRRGAMGHRPDGMQNLYVVGGLDPATTGYTAMVVSALDRTTEKRYVLDAVNVAGMSPSTLRNHFKRLTDEFNINEWVIERNAFQRFLSQDPELKSFAQSRGCKMTEHYTTSNKTDPDFGVMSMAPLFESAGEPPSNGGGGVWRKTPEKALIELPSDRQSAVISSLVTQLVTWEPSDLARSQKTDLVMALWFTEIAMKRVLGRGRQMSHHQNNPYASRARLKGRDVIDLRAFREAQLEAEAVG